MLISQNAIFMAKGIMIDFDKCKKINTLAFGGNNGLKIAVEYKGMPYMIKFAPHTKDKNAISYTNSCISEYIGCHIFNLLGIASQETLLGNYKNNGKKYLVVACKDFTYPDKTLLEFAKIKNGVLESTFGGQGLDLKDVLLAICEQEIFDVEKMEQRFWEMFVTDAYLGNFDRNNSNWGLLVNNTTKQVELAPVYDCGGCLYPQLDDEAMEKILKDKTEIENRVFVFPNSIYKVNDKKISYKTFLQTTDNKKCLAVLKIVLSKIDEEKINKIIDNTPMISETRKEFYKTMLHYRKLWILDNALKENKNA